MTTPRLLLFILTLAFVAHCNDDNDILAQYNDGRIVRRDLRNLVRLFNYDSYAERVEWQKSRVKTIFINKWLAKKAVEEKIVSEEMFKAYEKLLKYNIYRQQFLHDSLQKLDQQPELVYRARHLLLKINPYKIEKDNKGNNRTVDLSAKEKEQLTDELLQKISGMRADILSGKETLEKLAEKFSEDKGSGAKGGDLGWFPHGVMVPEFELALKVLNGEVKNKVYELTESTDVLDSASRRGKKIATLARYTLVEALPGDDKEWLKISHNRGSVGWIKAAAAKEKFLLADSKGRKLSIPVLSLYGWHIIELTESRMVTKEEFADLLADTEYKGTDKAKETALSKATQYWSRLKKDKQDEATSEIYRQFELDRKQSPTLPKGWEKKDFIFENAKLKIARPDFENFVNAVLAQQGFDKSDIPDYDSFLNRLFSAFIEGSIYYTLGEQAKLSEKPDFALRYEFEKDGFLASMYRQKKWQAETEPKDEEVKAEYENLKKRYESTKQKPPAFRDQETLIRKRLRAQKMQSILDKKEKEIIESSGFTLKDSNFREKKI